MCFLQVHSHSASTSKQTQEGGVCKTECNLKRERGRKCHFSAVVWRRRASSPGAGGRGVHWVAKGVKSQIAHLLRVPRPRERRKPVRRMKTETHFLYHTLWALPLNGRPLGRKRFPGFYAIVSFPAQSAQKFSSFASSPDRCWNAQWISVIL